MKVTNLKHLSNENGTNLSTALARQHRMYTDAANLISVWSQASHKEKLVFSLALRRRDLCLHAMVNRRLERLHLWNKVLKEL